MTIANRLRLVCGHDSRSVDGCLHCEAADAIEAADRAKPAMAELVAAANEACTCSFCGFSSSWPDRLQAVLDRVGHVA